jgi:hypothetical protein
MQPISKSTTYLLGDANEQWNNTATSIVIWDKTLREKQALPCGLSLPCDRPHGSACLSRSEIFTCTRKN